MMGNHSFDDDNGTAILYIYNAGENEDPAEVLRIMNGITAVALALSMFSNIINSIVFLWMGLADVMNLCLFTMSVNDVVGAFVGAFAAASYFMKYADFADEVRRFMDVDNLWDYCLLVTLIFQNISTNITSLVAVERCLCVVTPFKVKEIVTLTRTQVILCLFVVFAFLVNIPQFLTAYFHLVFNTDLNVTRIEIVYTEDRQNAVELCYILTFLVFDPIAVVLVLVAGVIMIRGLQHSAKFRRTMESGPNARSISKDNDSVMNGKRQLSANNVRLVKMMLIVIFTSTVIHLFSIMFGSMRIIAQINPNFAIALSRSDIFYILVFVFQFLYALNMGINTIIYFHYNTKFRNAFVDMMPCFGKRVKKMVDEGE